MYAKARSDTGDGAANGKDWREASKAWRAAGQLRAGHDGGARETEKPERPACDTPEWRAATEDAMTTTARGVMASEKGLRWRSTKALVSPKP